MIGHACEVVPVGTQTVFESLVNAEHGSVLLGQAKDPRESNNRGLVILMNESPPVEPQTRSPLIWAYLTGVSGIAC